MGTLFNLPDGTFLGIFKSGDEPVAVFVEEPSKHDLSYPAVRIVRRGDKLPFRVHPENIDSLTEEGWREQEARVAFDAFAQAAKNETTVPSFHNVFMSGLSLVDGSKHIESITGIGNFDFSPALMRASGWHYRVSERLSQVAREMVARPVGVDYDAGIGRPPKPGDGSDLFPQSSNG